MLHIHVEGSSGTPHPEGVIPGLVETIGGVLESAERELTAVVEHDLRHYAGVARDRTFGDGVFGKFTHGIMIPYARAGFSTRAGLYACKELIPLVLDIEVERGLQFHKGALFYDTALAFFLAGDDTTGELLIAMTDEEEVRTVPDAKHPRGTANLKNSEAAALLLQPLLEFFVTFLTTARVNEPTASDIVGQQITADGFERWRRSVSAVHQFELFRVLRETHFFCTEMFPRYTQVNDKPIQPPTYAPHGLALSIMQLFRSADSSSMEDTEMRQRLRCGALEIEDALKELSGEKFIRTASFRMRSIRDRGDEWGGSTYTLEDAGRTFVKTLSK